MEDKLKKCFEDWIKKYSESSQLNKLFKNLSDIEIRPIYTPLDIQNLDYMKDLGFPGEYPFTRGIYTTMYRGRLWTMRQFSGFGTAEDTNKRYHFLLSQGQTGLSVAFDMPTIMGYDSDSPRARGEVGICGVAVDTLKDMEILFKGIPLEKITTSMTINAPASILFAMYVSVAEKQGADIRKISGTIQNDILKEYIAQKSWIFPPEPSMRIIVNIFEYASKYVPKWNTISISGYHIREAGSTAVQELAFTLADGIEYVRTGIKAGLDVDEFAPRLSFFFNCHNDFFEEIAKFRAARRMWARIMKEKFKAKNPLSWLLRFHTQTAGCTLVAQQPMNNIIRVTLQALAAILGGTQSLHTNSMDETLALPTELAVMIALRTQQIIAEESGVTNTIDPLGGSYYVEYLTNKMEEEAWKYINKIEEMGGMIKAIEAGFPQREIADASYRYQKEVEEGKRTIVGVNKYQIEEKIEIPILKIPPDVEEKQIKRLQQVKRERNNEEVRRILDDLKRTAEGDENLMPYIFKAVKAYATEGEIISALKEVFGEYKDPGII
jgi:methylmalonyl-CoA mutase N-terminal domain/subunit